MAAGKKSFLFYTDWVDTFKKMPKDKGYDLLMHILSYVNDENPETDDILIDAVFQQIKNTLKRDLNNWENQQQQRKEAGLKSAEIRKRNATSVNERSISSTDNVSVSDNVNDSDKIIKANAFVNYSVKDLFNYLQSDKHNIQAIECYWNLFAEKYNVPKISKINDKRRKKLKIRSKEEQFDITKILAVAKDQKWLIEQTFFTFDWMIESESNYTKVLEGNYKEKPKEEEKPKFIINGN